MRFRKEKKEKTEKVPEKKVERETDLKTACGENEKVYDALREFILLHPWRVERMLEVSIEETIKRAEKKIQDPLKERASCKLATQLAIYIGDSAAVKKFGERYSKLTGERLKILDVLEQAMKISQKYYREQLAKDKK